MFKKQKKLVIALGNDFRSDDGLGPNVLRALAKKKADGFELIHHKGDPADLIESWSDRDVIIVDTLKIAHCSPGRVFEFDPLKSDIPEPLKAATSSHALSFMEAVELGRVLNKLPQSIVVIGAVGTHFHQGNTLTETVSRSIDKIVMKILKYGKTFADKTFSEEKNSCMKRP